MNSRSIPEYFEGTTVFLTGGTGFLGKVLIEKILRSCPGVEEIYMLLRPKRGLDLQERMEKIYNNPVFDRLKAEAPGSLQKLKAVEGDITQLGLGLSQEDRKMLVEKVNVIFHVAATVRFDQPMKEAVIMNTRGTREVCELALEIKGIKMVMHVSTAYCQLDKKVVEEKMYPPQTDWRKTIAVAEHFDKDTLNLLAPIYMEKFPNTYTFTKSLAEDVVYDMLNGKIPNVIFRPTVVMCSNKEPKPGWVDNFNGPFGMAVANSTGLVRVNYLKNCVPDFLPVDAAIRSMLTAAWYKGTRSSIETKNETEVYNCPSNRSDSEGWADTLRTLVHCHYKYPIGVSLWNPKIKITSSFNIFYIYFILFSLVPALILDWILKLTKKKPMALILQKKFYTATLALDHFTTNAWTFKNDKLTLIESQLLGENLNFKSDTNLFTYKEYMTLNITGSMQFLLNKDSKDIPKHRRTLRILYWLDQFVMVASYLTFFYFVFYKWNILGTLGQSFINYYDNLEVKL